MIMKRPTLGQLSDMEVIQEDVDMENRKTSQIEVDLLKSKWELSNSI